MIVCADDYGLSAANHEPILELGRNGKISAVSVMVSPCSGAQGCPDKDFVETVKDRLDAGLHLVLTDEGAPVSDAPYSLLSKKGKFASYKTLVARAYLNMLDEAQIHSELMAQISVFQQRFGRFPDYIDGHLHVHQLPLVRRVVASIAADAARKQAFYVRNTWEPLRELIRRGVTPCKHAAIAHAGLRLKRLLDTSGVPTNRGFAGIYNYRQWRSFPLYFEKRILPAMNHHNAIVMTHPGYGENWRRSEFETLLKTRDLRPNRFRHI